jgi:hypothetical protein
MNNNWKFGMIIVAVIFCSCAKTEGKEKYADALRDSGDTHETNLVTLKEKQGYYIIKNGQGDYINDSEISKVLELKVDGNDDVIVNEIASAEPEKEHIRTDQYTLRYDGDIYVYTRYDRFTEEIYDSIALDFGDGLEGCVSIVRNGYRYEKIESSRDDFFNTITKNQGYYIPMRYGNPYFYDTGFDEILELEVDKNEVIVNKIDFENNEKIIEDRYILEYDGTKFTNGDITFDYVRAALATDAGEQMIEYMRFVRKRSVYVKIDYEPDGLPAMIRLISADFRKSLVGEYVFESIETAEGTEELHLEGVEIVSDAVIYIMYNQNKKKLLSKTNMPRLLKGLDRQDVKVDINGFFSAVMRESNFDILGRYYFVNNGITLKYRDSFWDAQDPRKQEEVLVHTIKFVKKPTLWETPNLNGNGEETERLEAKGRAWTARKLEQELLIDMREGSPLVNVREFPGITERVLFQLDNGSPVETLAITKESETLDGLDSEWVKIRAGDGRTGWVFGAYTGVKGREGPKFLTPENIEDWRQEHGIRPFADIE